MCALVAWLGPLSVRRLVPRRRSPHGTRLGELEDGSEVSLIGTLEISGAEPRSAVGVEAGLFRRVVHPCFAETTDRLSLVTEEGVVTLDGPLTIRRGAIEAMWLLSPPELPVEALERAARWGYPGRGTTVRILRAGDRVALTGIARCAPAASDYRSPGEAWALTPAPSRDETEADAIVGRFVGRPKIAPSDIGARFGCAALAALFVLVAVHLVGFFAQPEPRWWGGDGEDSVLELPALISPAHRVDTLRVLRERNLELNRLGRKETLDQLVLIEQALPCERPDVGYLLEAGLIDPVMEVATRCRDAETLDALVEVQIDRGEATTASRLATLAAPAKRYSSWPEELVLAHLLARDADRMRALLSDMHWNESPWSTADVYLACAHAAVSEDIGLLRARWRDTRYPGCALLLADRVAGDEALEVLGQCPECWRLPELEGATILSAIRAHGCATNPRQVCFALADQLERWAHSGQPGPFSLEDEVRTTIEAVGRPPPAAVRIRAVLAGRIRPRRVPRGRLDGPPQIHSTPGWESHRLAAAGTASGHTPFRAFEMVVAALEHPELGLAYFLYPGDNGRVRWLEPMHHGPRDVKCVTTTR